MVPGACVQLIKKKKNFPAASKSFFGEIETDRGRLDQWMIRTGTFPSGALTTEGDGPETVIGYARQALDIDSDNMVWSP